MILKQFYMKAIDFVTTYNRINKFLLVFPIEPRPVIKDNSISAENIAIDIARCQEKYI